MQAGDAKMDADENIESEELQPALTKDYIIQPCDYNTDSEQSTEEFSEDEGNTLESYYVGIDGTAWRKSPYNPDRMRTLSEDLLDTKGNAKQSKTELECFMSIIDQEIIDLLVKYTNVYIEKIKNTYKRNRDANLTNEIEIRAFIGILYLIGTLKSRNLDIRKLWDTSNLGVEAIYVTISQGRFHFILRCLAFDDDLNRKGNKLDAVQELVNAFVLKSQNALEPSELMTIDEQYVECELSCTFLETIPMKSKKFGLKINTLIDVKSLYTYNIDICVRPKNCKPYQQALRKKAIVKRLIEPIKGVSRNLTMDHRFTSVPLALDLLTNYNISMVGTINKHNIEIPREFKKSRDVRNTIFGFSEQCTILSYMPKRKKCILGLSTMHYSQDTESKDQPDILSFYDRTKYASDLLEKMCNTYDVAIGLQRWPLAVFFHILNLAGINALVIHQRNVGDKKIDRCEFLRTLALDLMRLQIMKRISTTSIPFEIQLRGRLVLKMNTIILRSDYEQNSMMVLKCYMCKTKSKMSKRSCAACLKAICSIHSYILCTDCA